MANSSDRVRYRTRRELTPANLISLSRPVIALGGLVVFRDEPFYMTMALGVAILTDVFDGNVARWFNRARALEEQSRFGGYVDLAADRMMQLGALWVFYLYDMVSLLIPLLFSIKDAVFDPARVYMDLRRGKPNDALGEYNKIHGLQKFIHGLLEAVLICGVPLFTGQTVVVLGLVTAGLGYFRGVDSILYARRRERRLVGAPP